jgi:hypothetical protein
MFQEDINLVKELARQIAREEIIKALLKHLPPTTPVIEAPKGIKVEKTSSYYKKGSKLE